MYYAEQIAGLLLELQYNMIPTLSVQRTFTHLGLPVLCATTRQPSGSEGA